MKHAALKKMNDPKGERYLSLVETMDIRDSSDRSWFKDFLGSVFSSPDLDLSQFERLEGKRTQQQMRREGLY